MDSIEDALAWLFTKSEDEILADAEIAARMTCSLRWRVDLHKCQQKTHSG